MNERRTSLFLRFKDLGPVAQSLVMCALLGAIEARITAGDVQMSIEGILDAIEAEIECQERYAARQVE